MSVRRIAWVLFAVLLFCGGALSQNRQPGGERKIVDFQADIMRPIKISADSSVLNLLGHVVFYHNGAVITCDSAIRYNDKRMECFHNVIVNKDSTYIYGDRAEYNGEVNEARIYAPIIKMVDGNATLYTYHFTFNTLTNVGEYHGGGTMEQEDNLLESQRGYYYADTRQIVCVDSVQVRNDEYQMKSDSAAYNLDTQQADFFDRSIIWNAKGEILRADRGTFYRATSDYRFTKDSYVLTEAQEIWSDSIYYNTESEHVQMFRNAQLRDEEHKVMAFGDFGQYWGDRQDAMLTRNPSVISFDPEQDTLYMRADSMFLFSIDKNITFGADTVEVETESSDEEELILPGLIPPTDSAAVAQGATGELPEAIADASADSLSRLAELSPAQLAREARAQEKAEKLKQKEEEKRLAREAKEAKRQQKEAEKQARKARRKGLPEETIGMILSSKTPQDTSALSPSEQADSLAMTADSTVLPVDSLLSTKQASDTLSVEPQQADSLSSPADSGDSLQRVIKGYFNVKIYRNDFQAVCDSLVAFSIDSTAHLYIDPVMWNEQNQITADVIDLYSRNQQLYKAVFTGTPMMISEVDTLHYNQVKGKVMEAFFRDNDIYRTDVNGNGQTYYYMTDDETGDIMGFLVAECADITFLIDNKQMDKIIYRGEPVYTIYPMDKIPPDLDLFLPGYSWEVERRPSRQDVFDRMIRPSQRDFYEKMAKPLFPLTDSILKDRERMMKAGIWYDRNDTLSPEALDFIRSISNR